MALSINPITYVIYVPKADLTLVSGTIYSLDTDAFRLELKSWEDSEEGIVQPKTHNHNTSVTVAGTTYARSIEILAPYSVEFEDGQYTVILQGSNNNIFDVANGILVQNQVQVIPTNAAGLIVVETGSAVTAQDKTDIIDGVWDHADGAFLIKVIKNKKGLAKSGSTWQLTIYDDDDTTPILTKNLKDKDILDIADLSSGTLAVEERTSV